MLGVRCDCGPFLNQAELMKIAFLMNPLETVKAYKDTTYYLMLAARERGNEVFYFNQESMQAENEGVSAIVERLDVHDSVARPFTVLERARVDLAVMDAIVVRTDPPFDRSYLYATLLLDFVSSKTLVVNRPSGIRNWNEKLAALFYPDLTPDTLVSSSTEEILRFLDGRDRITLKPVDGHGGKGIVFLNSKDSDKNLRINGVSKDGRHWIIAQEYLPDAQRGDKRILLVEGEPIGAVLRVHAAGEELNNLDQGGEAVVDEMDARDWEICTALKPGLIEQGIFFCGIDVIGGKLIEVNVTSPTCLQELCRFSGVAHHHRILQRLEELVQCHGAR